MKQKYQSEIDGLMEIRNGILKFLGMEKVVDEKLAPLSKQLAEQGKQLKLISTQLSQATELTRLVSTLSKELDSLKGDIMKENIRASKDYTLALDQFQYLNERIGKFFKRQPELRMLYFDLLSGNSHQFKDSLKSIMASIPFDEECKEDMLNLEKEINDFTRRLVPIIADSINRTCETESATAYEDHLIYPHSGDLFNATEHENKFDDDGDIVDQVFQIGCSFPMLNKKAIVTVKTM